jgi:hypothetical protein
VSISAPSVVPIFATPLGIAPLPQAQGLNPALRALFAARAAADTTAAARGCTPLCYVGRDDLLEWTEEPVRKLTAAVLRGVYSVVAEVNDFAPGQLQTFTAQARGWLTILRPDGCLPATLYPLTSWCAIYCVAGPEPSPLRRDSGVLRLYESRLGTMFSDATNSGMRMPFRPGHCTWRPVPGELAVFPASVTHEIALLRSADELTLVTLRIRFVAPGQEGHPAW